jgi:peptidyl-prolyl cis-trans isomerase C
MSPRLALLLVAALAGGACRKEKAPAKPAEPPANAIAQIDDDVITLDDLTRNINRQPLAARPQYEDPARRKQLLDSLVRFELLANEAKRQGLDKDPEVIRATRQQMISLLLQREVNSKSTPVSDADIQAYYDSHTSEFNPPDAVRISGIIVADAAVAARVAREARALRPGDEEGFAKLARKYSEDEYSRSHEGDLGIVEVNSRNLPKPVIDAALALKNVNDISAPVEAGKGRYILRLTQRRPATHRSLVESRREIENRLATTQRSARMDAWLATLRGAHKVQVFEDRLAAKKP